MDEEKLKEYFKTIAENQNKIVKKMQEILERVGVLEDAIGSKVAGNIDVLGRVEKLEKTVSGHGTLLVDLRGQEAVDLHTSFPVKKENGDENTSKNREWATDLQKSSGVLGVPEEERGEGDSSRPAPAPGQAD